MRVARIFAAAAVLLSLALPAAGAPAAVSPREMTFPPLDFRIPRGERLVLENGMTVILVEEHELPLVNVTAYIRTGAMYEPAGKEGLAALTGAVMRSGGTAGIEAEKLDAELEYMASSVESSIGEDAANVSVSTLRKNLQRTLEIFAAVLREPAFREDRVELARKRALEAIRRQNDDPKEVGDRELRRLIYADTPMGRVPTAESVASITRRDLADFHHRYFHPDRVILAVSGDVTAAELKTGLQRVFGDWKREKGEYPAVAQPEPRPGGVYLVRKGLNQSAIRMGHLGISKDNPDLFPLRVMDFILGGNGFTSRLMAEIRARRGLAYNVESTLEVGRFYPGTIGAETETKSTSTATATGLMLEIMKSMQEAPVTEEEIGTARDSIINSFIFAFTKPEVVANQRARLEYYGYPDDWLETYRERIARVTREEVLRAAKSYLHPERMFIVVVGNDREFDKPLSTFGKVTEIRLSNEAPSAPPSEK